MSLIGGGLVFQVLPALGFADATGAAQGMATLLERGGAVGRPPAATDLAALHPFMLEGVTGFVLRTRAPLALECRPSSYLLCLAPGAAARVGDALVTTRQALVAVPHRGYTVALDEGGMLIAALVPAAVMADLSRLMVSATLEAFGPQGVLILPLTQWPWRGLRGLTALLLAGLGIATDPIGGETPRMGGDASPSIPRHVKRAEDYLARHMAQPVTVAELAARVGASPRSLNRAFLRFRGVTPSRYLQNLRIEAAHRLLSSEECLLDLRQVAAEVGFGSYAPFWRAYVRRYGKPPSLGRRRGGVAQSD
ncbi:helix-turn-helix domain-containing protein [Zavarzinia aquatilis]|uniref:HTH araC/xylS-type domain-containing protein n=1 Tax=Zavarzinia aquatilis TaxID=2211142 RepID=A0A317EEE5_9PROT|nr:AraC family transcriptional regulator [Zavarzinia aquatilis]PWR24634.1 hypothetical protein DKG74_07465 [Zavarzinia aquatilis]